MAHEESNVKPFGDAAPKSSGPPPAPAREKRGGTVKRVLVWGVLLAMLAAGAVFGWRQYRFFATHEETDDAQVETHVSPVLARVAGYAAEVKVGDNQKVAAGELLVTIDPGDLTAKVATARAALENARAAVAVARANAQAASTAREKAASDWRRYAALREKEEVSRLQADAAKAAADATVAQEEAARRQIAAAEAGVAQKKADLDLAELNLTYTRIAAPASGVISKKNVEVGQYVQPGQPLMAVVSDGEPWVVANFKETQLKRMRIGQAVELQVDAYPGASFRGTVDSFSAATGAKFALLPPDNATGNFTKVVQRVPVKIVLSGPRDQERPLRAGMSVNAIVDVR